MAAGSVIESRYQLQELAGAGGMATVWRAHDQLRERTVAIKLMSDSLAADPTALARFAREARTHAGITHPNLVRMYDYSVAALQPYLVLEYVPGCTLATRLQQGGLNAPALRRLASDLLSAIACVHDHGVLHRDIKPANVLLDRDGRARLTDFGIARLESSTRLTLPGDVVGTLRFLAPELLDGDPPSRQSDLFALGVLLRSAAAASALDTQLNDLIAWLTEAGPGLRPRDAHDALSALYEEPPTAVLSGVHPARGRPAGRLAGRLASRLGRRLIACAAGLAAVLVLLTATLGATHDKHAAGQIHPAPANAGPGKAASLDIRLDRLAATVRRATSPQR